MDLTLCLERLHRMGYNTLQDLVHPAEGTRDYHGHRKEPEALLAAAGLAIRFGSSLDVTSMGVDLYRFGVKPIIFPDM